MAANAKVGSITNRVTYGADIFDIARATYPFDTSTMLLLDALFRIGDTINFDDSYLSPVEIREIREARTERAKGEGMEFSNIQRALEWLHSD